MTGGADALGAREDLVFGQGDVGNIQTSLESSPSDTITVTTFGVTKIFANLV